MIDFYHDDAASAQRDHSLLNLAQVWPRYSMILGILWAPGLLDSRLLLLV